MILFIKKFYGPCLFASLILFSSSCGTNQTQKCANYYLNEQAQPGIISKIFYDNNGLISSIENNQVNTKFFYNPSGALTEVDFSSPSYTTKAFFYFNSSGQLVSTVRLDNDGGKIDSIRLSYDSQGRIESLNRFIANAEFVGYSQKYQYLDTETVQVDFYFENSLLSSDPLVYKGSFKYLLDGKHKPFPEQYYYAMTASTNVWLPSNYISLEIFGGTVNSTNKVTYSYNSVGYPLSDSMGNTYTYQCNPPTIK